jgi:osmoprotectant transport system ATP-binding protein
MADPRKRDALIELRNVGKSYDRGATFALKDLSVDVRKWEILVLLGSSGSGKTTALKLINRLIEPSQGTVWVHGRDVQSMDPIRLRRSIGYVFQGIGLFPHLDLVENVAMVARLEGTAAEGRRARARELLDLVGLPSDVYQHRFPDALSGGQRQRVGVARALAADPGVLLMDEPFGALDAVTRETLQDELLDLVRRLRKTVVFVTHNLFEAVRLGDRIAVLHEGELQQVGPAAELYHRPATTFVADLFGRLDRQIDATRARLAGEGDGENRGRSGDGDTGGGRRVAGGDARDGGGDGGSDGRGAGGGGSGREG